MKKLFRILETKDMIRVEISTNDGESWGLDTGMFKIDDVLTESVISRSIVDVIAKCYECGYKFAGVIYK